jgi:hypothetical protein
MAQRASIINDSIRDTLNIHNFIYHIIETDKEEVDCLDQVMLTPLQKEFFKNMIAEAARGTRYEFYGDDKTLSDYCGLIINDPATNFIETSKDIVKGFKKEHLTSFSDGVVIVALVSMTVNTLQQYFVAILKVDYTKVFAQKRDPNSPTTVSFTEIADSLAEDKSAIQKRALIDISNVFDWDVLAVERNKSTTEQDTEAAISKYFKKFLGVKLQQNDSSYVRVLPAEVHKWARAQNDPEAADKKARTYNLILAKDGQSMTVDDIKTTVCSTPEQEKSFDEHMDKKQLNGVQFIARKNSLVSKDNVTKLKNEKGVQIIYSGEMKHANIRVNQLTDGTVEHIVTSSEINIVE